MSQLNEQTNDFDKVVLADKYYVYSTCLGSGTFGKVFQGCRIKDGFPVAIKQVERTVIPPSDYLRDSKRGGIVPREAYALARLDHRNIVQLIDVVEDGIAYYVILELPVSSEGPCKDLFDYVDMHSLLSEETIRNIFRQVVSAVAYMHQTGYVHRDIKEENILWTTDGRAILIDFGSAACIPKRKTEYFVEPRGTLCAIAPECYTVSKEKIASVCQAHRGVEQEMWALGVLLYVMSYKQQPFDDNDHEARRSGIRHIPTCTRSNLLVDLINRLLTVDINQRMTMKDLECHDWLLGRNVNSSKSCTFARPPNVNTPYKFKFSDHFYHQGNGSFCATDKFYYHADDSSSSASTRDSKDAMGNAMEKEREKTRCIPTCEQAC